jgi:DNA polymerase III gamma/tau subunit
MSFHQKYRPTSLDRVIGHSKAVSALKGFTATGKFPSAILFAGPTSVGKTTLARAFANDVLNLEGSSLDGNPNWFELNTAESKTLEDVRGVIQVSRLRPQNGAPRRFVLCDEVQQLLSNAHAAQAFLKPLEEPVSTTTFLLGTMEPDKFKSTVLGKAIANRCLTLMLETPTEEDLTKQAKRIIKGEKMSFMTPDLIDAVVKGCDSSMRTLANVLESLAASAHTKKDITADDIQSIIKGVSPVDEVTAVKFLTAVYAGKFAGAQKALLEMTDAVSFINKVCWAAWFVLNNSILKGARHPKVWGNTHSYALVKQVNTVFDDMELSDTQRQSIFAEVNSRLVKLKLQSGVFSVDEALALSAFAWDTIQALKKVIKP